MKDGSPKLGARSTFLSKEYNKNKILNNLLTKSSKKFVEISTSSNKIL
jgi:hypothetical protein